jgi:FtsZ-binding cell division protein ZapB
VSNAEERRTFWLQKNRERKRRLVDTFSRFHPDEVQAFKESLTAVMAAAAEEGWPSLLMSGEDMFDIIDFLQDEVYDLEEEKCSLENELDDAETTIARTGDALKDVDDAKTEALKAIQRRCDMEAWEGRASGLLDDICYILRKVEL